MKPYNQKVSLNDIYRHPQVIHYPVRTTVSERNYQLDIEYLSRDSDLFPSCHAKSGYYLVITGYRNQDLRFGDYRKRLILPALSPQRKLYRKACRPKVWHSAAERLLTEASRDRRTAYQYQVETDL